MPSPSPPGSAKSFVERETVFTAASVCSVQRFRDEDWGIEDREEVLTRTLDFLEEAPRNLQKKACEADRPELVPERLPEQFSEQELSTRELTPSPEAARVHAHEHEHVQAPEQELELDQWSGGVEAKEGIPWEYKGGAQQDTLTTSPDDEVEGVLEDLGNLQMDDIEDVDAVLGMDATPAAGDLRRLGEPAEGSAVNSSLSNVRRWLGLQHDVDTAGSSDFGGVASRQVTPRSVANSTTAHLAATVKTVTSRLYRVDNRAERSPFAGPSTFSAVSEGMSPTSVTDVASDEEIIFPEVTRMVATIMARVVAEAEGEEKISSAYSELQRLRDRVARLERERWARWWAELKRTYEDNEATIKRYKRAGAYAACGLAGAACALGLGYLAWNRAGNDDAKRGARPPSR